ncbi:MAG: SDR family oxidoreductase [Actinobacteria bacterium]|nr:SDR family oxidoreductase [Actinomycetota bacterium]
MNERADFKGKTALVTGAASGMGKETALLLGSEGCTVLIADVNADRLHETSKRLDEMGVINKEYHVDLARADKVERMADSIIEEFGGLDILVNAAGVTMMGDLVDVPLEEWRRVMGVNFWGTLHTIHFLLPSMVAQKRGSIVNVVSGAGLFGLFSTGPYTASKFAVMGLSETIYDEVREHNIRVTAYCPGDTATPIFDKMKIYTWDPDKLRKVINSGFKLTSPEVQAQRIIKAIERGRALETADLFTVACYNLKRFCPPLFRLLSRLGRAAFNRYVK